MYTSSICRMQVEGVSEVGYVRTAVRTEFQIPGLAKASPRTQGSGISRYFRITPYNSTLSEVGFCSLHSQSRIPKDNVGFT